jgi:hypothetical protein
MVVAVHGDARRLAQEPVVGQGLRPPRIDLEARRHRVGGPLRRRRSGDDPDDRRQREGGGREPEPTPNGQAPASASPKARASSS